MEVLSNIIGGLSNFGNVANALVNYFGDNLGTVGKVFSSALSYGLSGGTNNAINDIADAVSNSDDASLDPTGYDQSSWDLEKTRELLEEQRAYNSAEAQKNRDWQERMSNTAYQRAVEDLESAGLNKWLAITGGNGASASTPSGATASSSSGDASTPNPKLAQELIKALTSIFNSGLSILKKAI